MLDKITIGKYYATKSLIHNMHPLAKLICVLLFVITTFIINDMMIFIILIGITLALITLSNVPLNYYLKQIWSIKILIIFIIIINLILNVSYVNSLFLIIRLILIVVYAALFMFTTTTKEVTYALGLFCYPLSFVGINSKKIAFTISLALRFIPTIMESSQKILKAQASRGIDLNNSKIKDKFLAIKSLILPMFILSFKKSDELSEIMELRLYSITDNHNKNYKYNWNYVSIYMPIIHFLILVAIVMKEVIM